MAYHKTRKIDDVMPARYCQYDAEWIYKQLAYCRDLLERVKVCEAYSKVYAQAFDDETKEMKKTGTARRTANTRLRIYVRKKSQIFCYNT